MIAQSNQRLTGDSICQTAREGERVFREVLAFYESCPINDPTGEMRRSTQENIGQLRQTQASVCAG